MKWFKTIKEARKAQTKRDPLKVHGVRVHKWKFSKRKRPFFVGTELEWLNL